MKRLLRHFVINTFSLWTASKIAEGMVFSEGLRTLFIAGLALTVMSLFAKPIINLLLLPLNLVTFGLFRWVASAFVLYLVTLLIKDFKIVSFYYPGFTSKWIDIPQVSFQGTLSFIGFAFIISVIVSFIHWLIK